MDKKQLDKIILKFGPDVILIPLKARSKEAAIKWKDLTLEDTQTPEHQAKLLNGEIAVIVGPRSGNVCSLDLDSEQSVADMVDLNPWFSELTLTSQGNRGLNIWFRFTTPYPKQCSFDIEGKHWGELRTGPNAYTKICGIHPDSGKPYTLKEDSPLPIPFEMIKWPPYLINKYSILTNLNSTEYLNAKLLNPESESGSLNPETASLSQCADVASVAPEDASTVSCDNVSCNTVSPPPAEQGFVSIEQIAENAELLKKIDTAQKEWLEKADPEVRKLYESNVAPFYRGERSKRNETLVTMAPALYRVTTEANAFKLMVGFYEINKVLFNDTKEIHEKDCRAALNNAKTTFIVSLPDVERNKVYLAFNERRQDAYRIMRDLASKTPNQSFFMSRNELSLRLSCSNRIADEIIKTFEKIGLIGVLKKGQQWGNGVTSDEALATEFQWRAKIHTVKPASSSDTQIKHNPEADSPADDECDGNYPI